MDQENTEDRCWTLVRDEDLVLNENCGKEKILADKEELNLGISSKYEIIG